jgi:predicted MPP superfamily phosphohydrolase
MAANAMLYVLFAIAAVGHAVLWVGMVNRLHGLAMNRTLMKTVTALCGIAVAVIPFPVFVTLSHLWNAGAAARESLTPAEIVAWSYVVLCAAVCGAAIVHKLWTLRHPERRGAMLANHTTRINLKQSSSERLAGPSLFRWLVHLPGNQVFDIHVHEKQLAIPQLPAELVGLRIAHLSDLHMSGRIERAYFREVAERVNECGPDLVAITGDLVERDACIDWIPDSLGRLRAPGGVYYVLGNHDLRVDQQRLSAALFEAGLIHVGGRTLEISFRNRPLLLVGNELPWYGPAPEIAVNRSDSSGDPFRILLSHSPDQFGWAQQREFALVLAGHNHGGQVRFPLFGPLLSPSKHGTRYASGAFCGGNTVLHVSRGTASLTPLRYNCPPEIAILELRPGK